MTTDLSSDLNWPASRHESDFKRSRTVVLLPVARNLQPPRLASSASGRILESHAYLRSRIVLWHLRNSQHFGAALGTLFNAHTSTLQRPCRLNGQLTAQIGPHGNNKGSVPRSIRTMTLLAYLIQAIRHLMAFQCTDAVFH
ncbi:unnamed protein product [Sympodiomycopsis kandeliae]